MIYEKSDCLLQSLAWFIFPDQIQCNLDVHSLYPIRKYLVCNRTGKLCHLALAIVMLTFSHRQTCQLQV